MDIIPLYGHTVLRRRLTESSASDRLPASLLLHGPHGVGKQRLALWLGQFLVCERDPRPCGECHACRYARQLGHPDIHWFFPRPRLKDTDPSLQDIRDDYMDAIAERRAASGLYKAPDGTEGVYVAAVRAIVSVAASAPAMGSRKVFIIGDAERMVPQEGSDQAANAFLKLLEEPPPETTVILTSSEAGALLPTIRSRVVGVRVPLLPDADVQAFVENPIVRERLDREGLPKSVDERVRLAAGAPGALLRGVSRADAVAAAKRLLDAATSSKPDLRYGFALAQGSARARGAFADTLDALTDLLHARTRDAANRGDDRTALAAARAVAAVEDTKFRTTSNAIPQLATADLLRTLSTILR